jgi:hypothetical protein
MAETHLPAIQKHFALRLVTLQMYNSKSEIFNVYLGQIRISLSFFSFSSASESRCRVRSRCYPLWDPESTLPSVIAQSFALRYRSIICRKESSLSRWPRWPSPGITPKCHDFPPKRLEFSWCLCWSSLTRGVEVDNRLCAPHWGGPPHCKF